MKNKPVIITIYFTILALIATTLFYDRLIKVKGAKDSDIDVSLRIGFWGAELCAVSMMAKECRSFDNEQLTKLIEVRELNSKSTSSVVKYLYKAKYGAVITGIALLFFLLAGIIFSFTANIDYLKIIRIVLPVGIVIYLIASFIYGYSLLELFVSGRFDFSINFYLTISALVLTLVSFMFDIDTN